MVEWKQSRVDGEISVIELMEVSMIELKQINHDNWIECIELEVKDEQRQFVNPNIFSLAEAYVHSDASKKEAEEYYRCIPFAIYNEGKMIGFTMLTYEKEYDFDDKPAYEIYRLMIDKDNQGKGTGERRRKKSFYWYQNVIRTNGEAL